MIRYMHHAQAAYRNDDYLYPFGIMRASNWCFPPDVEGDDAGFFAVV